MLFISIHQKKEEKVAGLLGHFELYLTLKAIE
jgi:hypothetical protein